MRIAQVTSYFQPEFGYEEYYLSRKLSELGHEVSVVTSDRIFPFKNVKKLLKEIGSDKTTRYRGVGITELDGFRIYRLPTLVELFSDFNLISNVGKTLQKINPEIVHIHEPIQGGSALAAKYKYLGFKLLVDQHAYATTFEEVRTLKNMIAHYQFLLLRKSCAKFAFNRADAITAVTERTKQFMVKVYKIPPDEIEVVPLGIDTRLFKFDQDARKRVREELGVLDDTPIILTAGRIDRAKKFEQLIEAFSKLIKDHQAVLVILGSGDENYEKEIRGLVRKLDLEKDVKFIRFVKKSLLPNYYSAADIGFWNKASITILEAMCCQLPVVIPEQTTIKTYISNENGLLFPEDDIKVLLQQLSTLVADKKMRVRMGKNGIKLVKEKYSYDATTRKYLEIYNRILD